MRYSIHNILCIEAGVDREIYGTGTKNSKGREKEKVRENKSIK